MKNKPSICPYCNEKLVLEHDYSFEIVDKNKSHLDLRNTRKRFFYICQKCQHTVGEIKEDKVEWVSQQEAKERLKWIEENRTIKIKTENNENDDSWIWLLRLLDIASLFDNENNDFYKDKVFGNNC